MSFQNPLPAGVRQVVPDYVSDGVTTSFGFPFRLWNAADIYVGVAPSAFGNEAGEVGFTQLSPTQYTVIINGLISATVSLAAPQPSGTIIRIMGLRVPSRTTSVVNDGVLQSRPFESELDCVEATLQELRRDVTQEAVRAQAAEANLSANLSLQIATETARALAAEAKNAQAIADETSRAQAVEAALAAWLIVPVSQYIQTLLGLVPASLLPTNLPVYAGTYWNDGGVLCVTDGGLLPTSQPAGSGAFWDDGGVVAVTPGGLTGVNFAAPDTPGLYWVNGGTVCIS